MKVKINYNLEPKKITISQTTLFVILFSNGAREKICTDDNVYKVIAGSFHQILMSIKLSKCFISIQIMYNCPHTILFYVISEYG